MQLARERPDPTGRRKADALLAGIAEHLAARHLPCPRWTEEKGRFLDRLWLLSAGPSLRAIALAQAPVPLKRRSILSAARSLERV